MNPNNEVNWRLGYPVWHTGPWYVSRIPCKFLKFRFLPRLRKYNLNDISGPYATVWAFHWGRQFWTASRFFMKVSPTQWVWLKHSSLNFSETFPNAGDHTN